MAFFFSWNLGILSPDLGWGWISTYTCVCIVSYSHPPQRIAKLFYWTQLPPKSQEITKTRVGGWGRNCFVQSRDCVTFLPYVFPKQWDWLLSLCFTCFPLPSVCAICSSSLLATQGGSSRLFLRIWFLFHRCQLSFPFHEVVWWRKQCNIWWTRPKLWGFWSHCVFYTFWKVNFTVCVCSELWVPFLRCVFP